MSISGSELPFLDSVLHLGHLLSYNLGNSPDVNNNMISKANCLFASFPGVGPAILSRIFQSYCLSLYSSCLWSLSSSALRNIEVAFA